MYERDDGNMGCGLDRKLVGILRSWFPFYSRRLFKMSGGQACSDLALLSILHMFVHRLIRSTVSWRGGNRDGFMHQATEH